MHTAPNLYSALATAVLFLHALFIVWVVIGAVVTRIASHSSLVAYRFPDLGNSHGSDALAVSFNAAGELAGTKGGRRAIPRRLPAPLYGQAGLSGYFRNSVDGGRSARLRLQPGDLWQASLESPPSQPTADPSLVARILVIKVELEEPFFSWDHNRRHEAESWHERY